LKTDQLDIHTGGADLIPVHHTNEIAQSEAATGVSPFVRFWVHGQFIMVDGQKMSKSKGNFYRLADIEKKGFDPLALRYLYMTTHYRAFLNFTWEGITAAQNSLYELRTFVSSLSTSPNQSVAAESYKKKFQDALCDDLNMPRALAVVWEVVKSTLPQDDKYGLLMDFDKVLGLGFDKVKKTDTTVPSEITALAEKRETFRKEKKFKEADFMRKDIEDKGYVVEDTPQGIRVKKKTN